MKGGSSKAQASRMALQSIARDAGRARLGDRLPEERRPSRALLEELGFIDPEVERRELAAEGDESDDDEK